MLQVSSVPVVGADASLTDNVQVPCGSSPLNAPSAF